MDFCPLGSEDAIVGASTGTADGAAGSGHMGGHTILPATRQTSALPSPSSLKQVSQRIQKAGE